MPNYRTLNVKPVTKDRFDQMKREYKEKIGVWPTDDEFLNMIMTIASRGGI